jgi:hypothetical protein
MHTCFTIVRNILANRDNQKDTWNKIGLAGIMTWQQARKQAEKEVKKKQKANAKHIEIEF